MHQYLICLVCKRRDQEHIVRQPHRARGVVPHFQHDREQADYQAQRERGIPEDGRNLVY